MSTLKCLTWNVQGLRAKPKRNAAMAYLKAQHVDITVLVETHLTGQLLLSLKKPWVGWVYQAPYSAYSRGIALLVAKTAQFFVLSLRSDPQGKFLFYTLQAEWTGNAAACGIYTASISVQCY